MQARVLIVGKWPVVNTMFISNYGAATLAFYLTFEKEKKRGTLETFEPPSLGTPLGTMLAPEVME